MAYEKTIWEARDGAQLNRFGKEQETSSSVLLSNQPKNVTKKGTPFSVDNMNHIEGGIYEAHELIETQTQDLAAHKTDDTAHVDIRQKLNIEAQTREDIDNLLWQKLSTETQTREADVQNLKAADVTLQGNLNTTNENLNVLQQDFNAWIGRGGYLDAFDFGRVLSMHDPSDQQALTDYALEQIPSLQNNPALIWNGTKITNLFNGHAFVLTNTQDTDPPIFEWTDQGPSSIAPFDTDTGGFIIGANEQDPDGTIERVPGSGGKGRVKGWALLVEKIAELFSKINAINDTKMFLAAHPVNSLYETVADDESTAAKMAAKYPGSTWEAWGAGRVTVALNLNDPLFSTVDKEGGVKEVTLTAEQSGLPNHAHSFNVFRNEAAVFDHTHVAPVNWNGAAAPPNSTQNANSISTDGQARNASQPHTNLMPYKVAYKYKRVS